MNVFENKLFLGCLSWLAAAVIVGFLYFFIDFPGSVPLYVTTLLWSVAAITSAVTGLLVMLKVFETGGQTLVAVFAGLIGGAAAWTILSRIAAATLANLIG